MNGKKQIIIIVVALAVLASLVLGYILVNNSNKKANKQELLCEYNSDAINKLNYTVAGQSYSLEKKKDTWKDIKNKKNKIDSRSVQVAIDSLAQAKVEKKFNDYKNLADYGFETDNNKIKTGKQEITVTTKDGKSYTYYVGKTSPNDETKSYVMIKGDKNVYISKAAVFNAFYNAPESIGQESQNTNMVQ